MIGGFAVKTLNTSGNTACVVVGRYDLTVVYAVVCLESSVFTGAAEDTACQTRSGSDIGVVGAVVAFDSGIGISYNTAGL